MKAILTSVNYGDYLSISAEYNNKIFDEVIVITTESDRETIDVCNSYDNYTSIILPDEAINHHESDPPAAFNKGYLLNHGVKYLEDKHYKGFICSTDADTIFSNNFNKIFKSKIDHLQSIIPGLDNTKMLFGLPRYFINDKNINLLEEFMANPDVSLKDELQSGRYVGKRYNIIRSHHVRERALLGYCQIYYIDTTLKQTAHLNDKTPYYYQSEQFKDTLGLDTKLIGAFLTSHNRQNPVELNDIKQHGNILAPSGKDFCKPGYNFEITKTRKDRWSLWGCHIESPDIYCIHVGAGMINSRGRVSDRVK